MTTKAFILRRKGDFSGPVRGPRKEVMTGSGNDRPERGDYRLHQ